MSSPGSCELEAMYIMRRANSQCVCVCVCVCVCIIVLYTCLCVNLNGVDQKLPAQAGFSHSLFLFLSTKQREFEHRRNLVCEKRVSA